MEKAKSNGTVTTSPFPVFGDPKSYEHLSLEEKNKLTQSMLSQHKRQVKGLMNNGNN